MRVAAFCACLFAASSVLTAPSQEPDQPQEGQSATIHGVVVTANDKQTIPGAVVSLAASHRSMTTNDKGEFVFTGVPFGTEVVTTKKDGFLCTLHHEPRTVCVKSVDVDMPDTHVELTMLREAVVTGRVINQEGTPVRDLSLYLMDREITQEGLYAWRGLGATHVRTDANGVYRIAKLEPGFYMLLAPTAVDPPGDFSPPNPDHGYSATYYPGVLDQKEAQPLAIHAGDDVRADLTIRRESLKSITLNYLWELQAEPQGGQFGTCESAPAGSALLVGGPVENSHSFRFLAAPGEYKFCFQFDLPKAAPSPADAPLNSAVPHNPFDHYFGSVEFIVRDQPVTINDIPVQHSANLSLHVDSQLNKSGVSSQLQPAPRAVVTFELFGEDGEYNYTSWSTDKQVPTREFKDVLPGSYVVRASGNSSAYVASITCGSLNLLHEPLVIGPGVPACSIEATVRDDFATISIGFTPQARAQMAAYGSAVTDFAVIPVDNSLDLPYSGGVWTSELKKFQIPPGSYTAFLFDGRNPAWREPEFQKQLKRLGTPVTLAPGDNKTLLLDFQSGLDDPKIQPVGVAFGRVLP